MKKLNIFLFTCVAALSLTSCEDFLTENNPNAITNASFWKTGDDALKGLAATYGVMQYSDVMGGGEMSNSNIRTDVCRSNPWENGPISIMNFTYNETNDYLSGRWNDLYVGVFRANQVLENVPNIEMDEEVKATILAEAHFLRGLYFSWLMNSFNEGNIPMPLVVPKQLSEYSTPISERADVWAQVEADFKAALAPDALPEKWSDNESGRATWGAAMGLLGRQYLYEYDYVKAADCFKQIIESGLYELTPDISWNFDIAHEWNSESLFEVNFSDAVKDGMSGYNQDGVTGSEATTRGMLFGPSDGGGYRVAMPSCWVTKLYLSDPVDISRPENGTDTLSMRCKASIYYQGSGIEYYPLPSGKTEFQFDGATESHAYVKKFQNWTTGEDKVNARSGINERVLRLADVYLMYAECLLEIEDSAANRELAIEYINKVRRRSAVVQISSTVPTLDATTIYDTKEEIIDHLRYVERPLELAFEGPSIRWNDLRRWKIVKEWYTELSKIEWWFLDVVPDQTKPTMQFVLSAEQFDPEEHYYFPIPNNEVNFNPNI